MAQLISSPAPARVLPLRTKRLSLLGLVLRWIALARQRRDLRNLPAHLLTDIGVDQDAADIEGNRPFWDAPDHWKD